MEISIDAQIQEVKTEIAMRKRVYAKRVDSYQMEPEDAERKIAVMEAVLHTLQKLAPVQQMSLLS